MRNFSSEEKRIVKELFKAGEARYGDLKWWPADGAFEVAVGAVLTQNTAWKNVEKAIGNLRSEDALCPDKIAGMHHARLWRLIRPAGFYRAKARTLRNVSGFFLSLGAGEIEKRDMSEIRSELLSIKGVGEETADSILLYAFGKGVFVVDAYTRRVFTRHGIRAGRMSYADIQALVHCALNAGCAEYGRFHAQIVEVAKNFCGKKEMFCARCAFRKTGRRAEA